MLYVFNMMAASVYKRIVLVYCTVFIVGNLLLWHQCMGAKGNNRSHRTLLHIAGLFPMSRHKGVDQVGIGVLPAVKLAMEHINNDHSILPKHKLNMVWNDTQVSKYDYVLCLLLKNILILFRMTVYRLDNNTS